MKKAFGDRYEDLELVEADLLDEASMMKASEGCTFLIHTASPFPLIAPKTEDELIKPAVQGALGALKGAVKNGVKRVVMTSSTGAVE